MVTLLLGAAPDVAVAPKVCISETSGRTAVDYKPPPERRPIRGRTEGVTCGVEMVKSDTPHREDVGGGGAIVGHIPADKPSPISNLMLAKPSILLLPAFQKRA